MTSYSKQRAYASDLTTHGDYRGNCPFCGGRNTYTASTEHGVLRWNCYKLGCNVSGIYNTDMTATEIMALMRQREELKQPEKQTMEIPVYVVQPTNMHEKFNRFIRRHRISIAGLMYDVKDSLIISFCSFIERSLCCQFGSSTTALQFLSIKPKIIRALCHSA